MRFIISVIALILFATTALADDFIIKTPKLITVIGRFNSLGIGKVRNPYVKNEAGEDVLIPNWRIEDTLGEVMTPPQTMPDGSLVFRVRLSAKDANKLPRVDTPNFSVLWKTGDVGPETSWADADGNTVYVGRFAD